MNLHESVLATIAYHDIFVYPLKTEEVEALLIENRASLKKVKKTIDSLISKNQIGEYKKFYYLFEKRNSVQIRLTRAKHSQKKLKKAHFFAGILKLNPLIQMVGISGALAMENSYKLDDIDLVIITKANLLWTARLLSNLLLFPIKRKPGTNKSNNHACLNLFIDESDLRIKEENIYQAHEICQLKPVWQRNNTYYNFIEANRWVKRFLPNWSPEANLAEGGKPGKVDFLKENFASGKLIFRRKTSQVESKSRVKEAKFSIFNFQFSILENFFKNFQLAYMRRRVTTERIGEHQLFFHPSNTQERVLKEYDKRLKKIKILR